MSNLSRRLTQLRKQSGSKIQTARALVTEKKLAEKIRLAKASTTGNAAIQSDTEAREKQLLPLIGGEVYAPGLLLLRSRIKLDTLHDNYAACFAEAITQLDNGVAVEQLLFVDTETSGLSSAAGTLVFLIGAGQIQGEEFILEQMLLTSIAGEQELLHWFNKKCENKTHLVSYNGKSFDVPLLTTRYRMNRMASDLLSKSHIDLLHWIRRLHQNQMPDCRLPSAEKFCLGFERKNDLPGSEAPYVWQDMIRFNRYERIKPLVQHHAWDVISLAGLLHYADTLLSAQTNQTFDHYLMAKYLLANKHATKAKQLLEENINQLTTEALFLLSQIYRREGQWKQSVIIWHKLQSQKFLPAIESLAKYYEHKEKDLSRAIEYTKQLLSHDKNELHVNRMQRLERKLLNV